MNRVSATAELLAMRLPDVDDVKRSELEKMLDLDILERAALQSRQAILHASGLVSLEEAMTLYGTLNRWDTEGFYDKLAVLAVITQFDKPRPVQ